MCWQKLDPRDLRTSTALKELSGSSETPRLPTGVITLHMGAQNLSVDVQEAARQNDHSWPLMMCITLPGERYERPRDSVVVLLSTHTTDAGAD